MPRLIVVLLIVLVVIVGLLFGLSSLAHDKPLTHVEKVVLLANLQS